MLFLFLFSLFLNSVAGTCPSGSTGISGSFGTSWKCAAFVVPGKTYLPAETFCINKYNRHLASVPNGFANLFLARERF